MTDSVEDNANKAWLIALFMSVYFEYTTVSQFEEGFVHNSQSKFDNSLSHSFCEA